MKWLKYMNRNANSTKPCRGGAAKYHGLRLPARSVCCHLSLLLLSSWLRYLTFLSAALCSAFIPVAGLCSLPVIEILLFYIHKERQWDVDMDFRKIRKLLLAFSLSLFLFHYFPSLVQFTCSIHRTLEDWLKNECIKGKLGSPRCYFPEATLSIM